MSPDDSTLAPASDCVDIGRYRIERKLGEGGMGAVYLAHDPQLNRKVAIKLPTAAGDSARFLREARAAAALRHPNICPIYDCGECGGTPFLCMAFIAGETLAARLQRTGSPPVSESLALVAAIATGMHEAHRLNVIHRDLKPGNIMLDESGQPVVMDFGLARTCTALATQLTAAGSVLGTPAYMSPEQIEGDTARMGPACDIYSLGVILYELLCGRVPFEGDMMALAMQIVSDPPRPPSKRRPELDPALDSLCLVALEKDPARRWPSMAAFADALDAHRTGAPAGPALTLRIAGTPFAYRADPRQHTVTVGRQRRKPDLPASEGNDFVIRVTGDDELSLRISRRHLEITRTADGWSVTDRGKSGTSLNTRTLAAGAATPLSPGDRITIASAVTLEVVFDAKGGTTVPQLDLPVAETNAARLLLDATCGDLLQLD